ncbi:hypothetical protein L798_10296 [Zootermopsis nevadensis]|uniref:Uncharacterized protein n=1 Tax=Zootermopsis nevadensis TaxID=136037 RepID=A0A067RAT8_ZOONE|nr:hypothetical protein L798_10296 [Zootermopsis nevadensis]
MAIFWDVAQCSLSRSLPTTTRRYIPEDSHLRTRPNQWKTENDDNVALVTYSLRMWLDDTLTVTVENIKINFDRFSLSQLQTCQHPSDSHCECCTLLSSIIQNNSVILAVIRPRTVKDIHKAILVRRSYTLHYHNNWNID